MTKIPILFFCDFTNSQSSPKFEISWQSLKFPDFDHDLEFLYQDQSCQTFPHDCHQFSKYFPLLCIFILLSLFSVFA